VIFLKNCYGILQLVWAYNINHTEFSLLMRPKLHIRLRDKGNWHLGNHAYDVSSFV